MTAIEFLEDYFNDDEHFIIAQKHPIGADGKVKNYHTMLNIKDTNFKKQMGRFYYLNKNDGVDIYFSLNTYKSQNTFHPSRKEEFVNSIKSFYFDIDKGDIEEKKRKIIELFGEPTYKTESSLGKFQFIYKFKEPHIVKNKEERDYFKKLLKGLIYHFDVDKTFDTARIFRLASYMNKKTQNNNFIVTVEKFPNYYYFTDFEKVAKNYLLAEAEAKKPRQKTAETRPKAMINKNTDIDSSRAEFEEYKDIKKIINRKYIELLNKYHQDKSTADLAYARWLRTAKQITDDEIIIKKIFEARGYEDIMKKHQYQIQYYIENLLSKSL